MQIRIGTFNCENLYVFHRLRKLDIRFELRKKLDPNKAYKEKLAKIKYDKSGVPITSLEQGWEIKDSQRTITARSIVENQPDIIALQEVENLDTLNKFYRDFMQKLKVNDLRGVLNTSKKVRWDMKYRILVDGNDNHRIDVALMSRFPIKNIRTHIWDPQKNSPHPMFPRDCLEVDVEVSKNKIITFLVNHFTSRLSDKTGDKRKRQANEVIDILHNRFGEKLDGENFVILGDLNDSPKDISLKTTLYNSKHKLIDPLKQLPEQERWTHFWYNDETGKAKETSQLDHIILSPSFKKSNSQVRIERRGLLQTVKDLNNVGNIPVPFDGVSRELNTEGSDHCAVYVDLEVNSLV